MHTEVREPLILGGTGLKATLRPGSRKPSSSKQISRGLVLRLLCQGRTKGHGPWNDHPRNDLVNKMEVNKYLCKRLLATTCKQCVFTCDSARGRAAVSQRTVPFAGASKRRLPQAAGPAAVARGSPRSARPGPARPRRVVSVPHGHSEHVVGRPVWERVAHRALLSRSAKRG